MIYKLRHLPPVAFALAVTSVALVPTARAQLEPEVHLGSRIPVKPTVVDPDRAGIIKKAFARCLFASRKENALLVLNNSDPISVAYVKVGTTAPKIADFLGMPRCLGSQADDTQLELGLRLSSRLLRSMLAEEAYLARFNAPPGLPSGSGEELVRTFTSQDTELTTATAIARFADCVVFNNVVGADAILRTIPDSNDERKAAQALAPALGACLVQGQSLSLKPVDIRAFAADGLWTRFVRNASFAESR